MTTIVIATDGSPEAREAVEYGLELAAAENAKGPAEAGQAEDASAALGEALRLRRGEPLADFAYADLFDAERARRHRSRLFRVGTDDLEIRTTAEIEEIVARARARMGAAR